MTSGNSIWYPLAHRGIVGVSGADRVRWLNGMVTQEVGDLGGEQNVRRALLLSRQGRVLADFHVIGWEDELWLELEASHVESVIEHLERYIIADDVVLRDLRGSYARFALEGEAIRDALRDTSDRALPASEQSAVRVCLDDVSCAVAGYRFGVREQLQFSVDPGAADRLFEVVSAAVPNLAVGDATDWERLRVEAGTPRLGFELDESVLPDEAGLGDAVSTTKGCYTGQEVVARLRSRGTIKHRLVGLRFDGKAAVGDKLVAEGRTVGEVTSVVRSPEHGAIGLGFVNADKSTPGERLDAPDGAAEVATVPFAQTP
ncbi:MAG: folate-binding protein YgfZ [Myxococcales bacterium]|nr:folate-binding protein YgfZ [Myxococcales bacterium]